MNKSKDPSPPPSPFCSRRWWPSSLGGAIVPGGTPQANAADPVVLTVTGNGQTKTFTHGRAAGAARVQRLLRHHQQRRDGDASPTPSRA